VRQAYEQAGRPFRGVALTCVNRVPTARGLGSSAAAWVGGLVAGNALLGDPLPRDTLLALAARAEGHPDNVAAALFGGLTVSCALGDGRVAALSLPVPDALRWVVLVPEIRSATAEARAVLPESVPRGDAVFNVQRVALLLGALQSARFDVLGAALDDRLHQPYRLRLFPWMPVVVEAARAAGALGCVLSGAGPSLLAAVREGGDAIARSMEGALASAGIRGRAWTLAVDTEGAVILPT
jgi:homoserine kinase